MDMNLVLIYNHRSHEMDLPLNILLFYIFKTVCPGVTSFRQSKEQYYISVRHMHALSKEIEHMYK